MGLFCLILTVPAPVSGTDPVEGKLWDALTYLNAIPQIAWVEIEGRTVVLGWRGYPAKFSRINQTAARNASRKIHQEIQLYSVKAEQRGWRPGKENENVLCRTTARDGRLVNTNCR